jgi:membrane protein
LRYAVAAGLLILAIGVVVRHGTAERHPAGWLSPGAILATVGWIAVTAAFGAYITAIASFGSIYGIFVSVVVLLAWTYASSMAFLIGVATDAELRASS